MVNTSSTGQNPFEPRRNLALTARQVVYRNTLIELIQYKPTTESVYATPLLFIPPWINKFYILDMQPQNSLIKFMVDNGFTVFVISWKNPDAAMEEISFNDYLTLGPLNAFDVIKEIIGSLKVNPIGYCVSGTLLSAAILYPVAKGDDTINAATFFLKGIPIDLKQIQQDVYAVGAEQDHIVPWKSAWRISQLASGTVRFVLGDSGHIAGVINPPTKGRGYWTNDKPVKSAEQWFEGAEQHKGSWWTDWLEWLKTRSGEQVVPPSLGNEVHPPIVPAPRTYVLEK